MISKNLTPFFWGPKVTSRQPPQVEMAVCVRGVFKLEPGQPLEAIEDEIEQGFMSGHQWAENDPDRLGPVTCPDDFAEWKPRPDLLLKGTCHPPGGRDVVCDVGFGVGTWSKYLRVFGPRVYTPGVVVGGSLGDPLPFTSMPLTWQNAYGGPGHETNVVGKGFTGHEMPHIEDPKKALSSTNAQNVTPSTFLPISPLWPSRRRKIGKNYGKSWEATRAPFYSDDFDWGFFNCAPRDQQMRDYLRGDETVWFENLHPQAPRFEVQLPALRIRSVVKTTGGACHDLKLVLDTLYADLDAGRLYLTWRGLTPVSELDLTDVEGVLVASEPLASQPLPAEHYQQQLEAFVEDPVGLKEKMPPGVLEVGMAMLEARKANLEDKPGPDLKKLAETLPKDGPIAPWAVAAFADLKTSPLKALATAAEGQGLPSPFSKVNLPAIRELKGAGEDPLVVAKKLEALAEESEPAMAQSLRRAATKMRESKALKDAGAPNVDPVQSLRQLAAFLPPKQGRALEVAASGLAASLASARAVRPDAVEAALAPKPRAPKQTPGAVLEELPAKIEAAGGPPDAVPDVNAKVAEALKPLDEIELPKIEPLGDSAGAQLALFDAQEQAWRQRLGDHPILGMFAFAKTMTASVGGKLAKVKKPDVKPVEASFEKTEQKLLELGATPEALAPLVGLKERVIDTLKQLPGREPPAAVDYAYQELNDADFSGQELAGKSFAGAQLMGANFQDADLKGADFTDADLTGARLRKADLTGATLTGATLLRANLRRAQIGLAKFDDADLTSADLSKAQGAEVVFSGAFLVETQLTDAFLPGAVLSGAVLSSARLLRTFLQGANLELVQAQQIEMQASDLTNANLRMAFFDQSDMRQAKMVRADMAMASLTYCKAHSLDLTGAQMDMARFDGSLLVAAKLQEARSLLGSFAECDFTGAHLQKVDLEQVNMSKAKLEYTDLTEAKLFRVDLRDAVVRRSHFFKASLERCSTGGEAVFESSDFKFSRGARSVWLGAKLEKCDFSYAEYPEALFQMVQGEDVKFFAADLKGASFRKARLSKCPFVGADLCGADLTESQLKQVQFTKANLYDAKFGDGALDQCDFLEANMSRVFFQRTEGAPA